MSIRMVCVLLLFFVHGWWLLAVAIGAVVLPYIGVVLANNGSRQSSAPLRIPAGTVAVREPEPYVHDPFGPEAFVTDSDFTAPQSPGSGTPRS